MAENGIVGDQDGPTEIPQTQISEDLLTQEKNLAKYSKTKEFKELKSYLEARIEFFKNYLPDGKEVRFLAEPEMGIKWVVANNVINEFNAVLTRYEQARSIVKQADSNG